MVYVAVAKGLLLPPGARAIAEIFSLTPTVNGAEYTADFVFGVEPSVV